MTSETWEFVAWMVLALSAYWQLHDIAGTLTRIADHLRHIRNQGPKP